MISFDSDIFIYFVAFTIASIAWSNQFTLRLSTSPASLAAAIAGVIGI